MTKLFRHSILLLAALCLAVACKDKNAISSDELGTDGIKQGKVSYDTLNVDMREASGDTLDLAEAVKLCLQMPAGETSTESYYVLGYVSGFTKYETSTSLNNKGVPYRDQFAKDFPTYGNRYPKIINKLNNRYIECYRLMSFGGNKFKYLDQLEEGDVIVAYGKLQNYNNTAQISGGYLVTTSNPNAKPRTFADESFDKSIGAFTVTNEKAASTEVWKHIEAKNGAPGFMRANANIGGANEESECWLVSPKMNLTDISPTHDIKLTFTQYYIGDKISRIDLLRLFVTTDGNLWRQIPMTDDMWNDGTLPQFQNVTIDMKEYASEQTQIAFVYNSTTDKALTWAIKNVVIGEPNF